MSKLKMALIQFCCDDCDDCDGCIEIKRLPNRFGFEIIKNIDNTQRIRLTPTEAEVFAKTLLEMCGEGGE